jgi:copper chaperone
MTKFAVPEMSCPHCRASIEEALSRLDPDIALEIDLDARTVHVKTSASTALVLSVLSQAGFAANVSQQASSV